MRISDWSSDVCSSDLIRGRNMLRAALITPMVITPSIVGVIWSIMFQSQAGPLNWPLSLIGLPAIGWLTSPDLATISLIIPDVWHWTTFMFLLSLSALPMIPADLFDSAEVDGASAWQALVQLPCTSIRHT